MNKYHSHNWRSIFTYNEDTGDLMWKINSSRRAKVGSIAGCSDKNGYINITYKGVQYLAHQIIWCIIYGEPADSFIDHRDMDAGNNLRSNLRKATRSQNAINNTKEGVHLLPNGLWRANITVNSKRIYSHGCVRKADAVRWREAKLEDVWL